MILRYVLRTASAVLVVSLASCGNAQTDTPTTEAIGTELAALEQQVERLEDSKAIKRPQRAYGYYVDKGMGDRIGELFSGREDASVEIAGSGVYVGKDRISEFYEEAAPPLSEGQLFNHMILQGVVHVADDGITGKGRWRGLIQTGMYGESADWAEGPYENEYIKEDDVWKFHKVHWYATVMAPYDPGWHRDPQPMAGPSADNPPDLPPTDRYQTFPSPHLAPYHYEHPVTGSRASMSAPPESGEVPSLGDAWSRLLEIEARAARVEDINEIENLQRSYGYYLDKMLWDDVADLFTDDGAMEVGPSGVYEGRESIRAYLYSQSDGQIGPLEGELYDHMQLQPIVTVAPDGMSADARWRSFMQLGTYGAGSGGTWGEGVYENEYLKEDGVWKLSKLQFFPTFLAPYEGGWKNASPQMVTEYAMGKGVEADSPSSVDYVAYPEIFVVPFHYGADVASIADPVIPPDPEGGDLAALEARIAEVGTSIGLMNDVDQIENVSGIYGFYVDMSMQDDIADLFNEQGIVEILGRGVYVGPESVRRNLNLYGEQGIHHGLLHNHMQYQPVIHVAEDGQAARIRSRAFSIMGEFGIYSMWMGGVYENEFVKEDGIWAIQRDQVFNSYFVPYAVGFRDAPFRPPPGITDANPPDLPPTMPFDMYPKAFLPPFHYDNPVTGEAPPVWVDADQN